MHGYIALARRFYVLVGSARAVARGEYAAEVGFESAVDDDMPAVRFKSVDEFCGRKGVPQHENAVYRKLGVPENDFFNAHSARNFYGIVAYNPRVFGFYAAIFVNGDNVHRMRKCAQVLNFVFERLVVAQNGYFLAAVKVAVAGGAVAYASAQKLVLAVNGPGGFHARAQNDGASFVFLGTRAFFLCRARLYGFRTH